MNNMIDFSRGENFSRIPYSVYHDADVYANEQALIFRGKSWNFLCLEAEIPNPGDFRVVSVGETPVVVQRRKDSSLAGFENRCAHRGATVRRENHGNADSHICVYHRWSYDESGALTGVPFKRGVEGHGGMPGGFDNKQHGLKALRVESVSGAIFGTFHHGMEPVTAWQDASATVKQLIGR